ncbi:SCF E3 ubiquitin ligase complex F-box protein [Yarrowia sp. C11]|nr:SCF E3 ubiquitin ligase complex F-box protein [Yarrowia sp. E02]KAG5371706.1 SCF E3 ubiquitin ligase complex F-box protein [Yarrowia sp. C11]
MYSDDVASVTSSDNEQVESDSIRRALRRSALLRSASSRQGSSVVNRSGASSPTSSSSNSIQSAETDSDIDMDEVTDADAVELNKDAPVHQLPSELLTVIFTMLPERRDVHSCLLVSKTWFMSCVDLVWFRPHLPKDLTRLQQLLRTLKEPVSSQTVPYSSYIRRLNLTNLTGEMTDELLSGVAVCTRLERLTLANCTSLSDVSLVPVLQQNSGLQSVDVTNVSLITDATIQALLPSKRRLQGLYATGCANITNAAIVALATECRLLKRIKVNSCPNVEDEAAMALVDNCPQLVELDLHENSALSGSVATEALRKLPNLRELRVGQVTGVNDACFLGFPARPQFDRLRIIDLTACNSITDAAVDRLVTCAPKLRHVVLAKCTRVTDRSIRSLVRLGKSLHYLHLGHCASITDAGIAQLVRACQRIQYIDVANCSQLTDAAVEDLASLTKLRRIGLVKCVNITDGAIYALASRSGYEASLERVHLSYCAGISIPAVLRLVNVCPRLSHLSLTGVTAFLRSDFRQFCRDPPPEFTQHHQALFCVFSGDGVKRLRTHLNQLAEADMGYLLGGGGFAGGLGPGLGGGLGAGVGTATLEELIAAQRRVRHIVNEVFPDGRPHGGLDGLGMDGMDPLAQLEHVHHIERVMARLEMERQEGLEQRHQQEQRQLREGFRQADQRQLREGFGQPEGQAHLPVLPEGGNAPAIQPVAGLQADRQLREGFGQPEIPQGVPVMMPPVIPDLINPPVVQPGTGLPAMNVPPPPRGLERQMQQYDEALQQLQMLEGRPEVNQTAVAELRRQVEEHGRELAQGR